MPGHPGRGEFSSPLLQKHGAVLASSSLEVWLTALEMDSARMALPHGPRYVAIATGASKLYKCWATDHFASLVVWLQAKHDLTPVLFGGRDDPALPEVRSFLGSSLRQTAALIARCDFFVGNDSGLKHLAAAVGTPVIEINALRLGGPAMHHVSSIRFRAWGVAQRVVHPPRGIGECAIEEVSLTAVQTAVDELLKELSTTLP